MTDSKSSSDPHVRAAQRSFRIRRAGIIGAVGMALLLTLFAGPLFPEPLFDLYQQSYPRPIPTTRVLFVRIDAESLRALGPWPWPRSYLALLTDRLREGGASAVGYDLLFAEGDASSPRRFVDEFPQLSAAARGEILRQEPLDEVFARAAARIPTVVARTGVTGGAVEAAGAADRALSVEARVSGQLPPGLPVYPRATGNVEALEFAAAGQGVINGEPDPDGVTRRQPMAARLSGVVTPGFALDLARVALGATTITAAPDSLTVAGRTVPVGPDGRARLWFGTLPDGAEVSAVNVLRKPRRADAYRGRIAIIGSASAGLGDVRTTPLRPAQLGARLHAMATDAILKGHGFLDRPNWALPLEWLLGVMLAAIADLGFPRWGPRKSLWVSAAFTAGFFALSYAAFAGLQLLIDPMRPVLIGFSTGVAITIAGGVETARAARRLRESALAQQGEMKAARDIQQAMLPDRTTLAGLDPRLDLDAWLEPAQAIGGDLYDAFRMHDGRVCVLVGDVTGKGASAALFMAVSKALAHSFLRRGDLPVDLAMFALNAELAIDSLVEVTMLCAIIDLTTGAVELINAGHENPWLVHADGRVEQLMLDGGLPLCTLPGATYPLEHATLRPGDGLVLITDGVREAQNAAGGFFGSDRTRDVLAAWHADEPAHAATARLVAAVRRFEAGTPPSDDLTVLTLRWRGET